MGPHSWFVYDVLSAFLKKKVGFELGQQKGTCRRKHPGFLGWIKTPAFFVHLTQTSKIQALTLGAPNGFPSPSNGRKGPLEITFTWIGSSVVSMAQCGFAGKVRGFPVLTVRIEARWSVGTFLLKLGRYAKKNTVGFWGEAKECW